MKNLKSVKEIENNLRVILRIDSDIPMDGVTVLDNSRLTKSIPTIRLLLEKNCKIFIVGHRGRPEGREDKYSLRPVYLELVSLLESDGMRMVESVFVDDIEDREKITQALEINQIVFGENLRFWKGEEENKPEFLRNLMDITEAFVNDAFAVAHRVNASVMLWQVMDCYYGLSFIEEAEKIEKALNSPERPLTIILGGAKKDKLDYLNDLSKIADSVLIGGKLPDFVDEEMMRKVDYSKVFMGKFSANGLDINEETINRFNSIINNSRTIIWAGAMGFYESPDNRKGTEEVAKAIARVEGYKIIAGGDTGASIINLNLKNRIDFICSGGGVLLEYLTKGKLPAWE